MSRYIGGGWKNPGLNLGTIPDDYSRPSSWKNEILASARGEINYKLTDPRLSETMIEVLEKLRREIEIEMRKRLDVKESPAEFEARCLFHASEIDYRTGDRR